MLIAWIALAGMIIAYGLTDFLQAIAATKAPATDRFNPRLLFQLAHSRMYLVSVLFQSIGMMTAIVARRDLPLFLVQASLGAGLVITATLGVLVLGWRLPRAEIALILTVLAGVTVLVFSADPGPARPLGWAGILALGCTVVVLAIAAHFAARHPGARGAVTLGALAGLAFGAAAIASRPLAGSDTFVEFLTDPLLYIFGALIVIGQLLCAMALQRGTTTAAVAAMTAAGAIPPAIVGIMFLGDAIKPGWAVPAIIGFVLTVAATVALARYAEPQSHILSTPGPRSPAGNREEDLVASSTSQAPAAND